MRDIAGLVFGDEPAEPSEGCGPDVVRRRVWDEAYQEPPGNWCQTQPGDAALTWLGAAVTVKHKRAPR